MSTPLSAVIITLNAEKHIEACLKSLQFCDEVIVMDSGSDDNTKDIADSFGAIVMHQDWLGFGPQKQAAVNQARHDWVLCIDADEWISDALQKSIGEAIKNPQFNAYQFPRCNRFLGRWLRHGEGYPDFNLRLFHRNHASWSGDSVHEKVVTTENIGELGGDLMHESETSLEEYLRKQNQYTSLQAERLVASGNNPSAFKLVFNPFFRFIKFYIIRLGFLDGIPGLIHIAIGCQNTFMKYAKCMDKAREKQRQ